MWGSSATICLLTILVRCQKKSPYTYGVPYRYVDACTRMVILRIWVLTYIWSIFLINSSWRWTPTLEINTNTKIVKVLQTTVRTDILYFHSGDLNLWSAAACAVYNYKLRKWSPKTEADDRTQRQRVIEIDGRTNICMDGRLEGRADEQTDGQTDGWTDGRVDI